MATCLDWLTINQLNCLVFGYCQNNYNTKKENYNCPNPICQLIVNKYLQPNILLKNVNNNTKRNYMIYDTNNELTLKNLINKLTLINKNNIESMYDIKLFANTIDFGFIYGDDPKAWPPPMKICKQMIDAMGGYNSNLYKQFQEHMVSCYKQLRKSANLILNLLSLMGGKETVSNRHANNISKNEMNIAQSIEENVTFVHNKFRLDLNEEEAAVYLQNIAEQSVNALFTKIVDKVHDWVTYWR